MSFNELVFEIIEVCEALSQEKRMKVINFARFLLDQQDNTRWKNLIEVESLVFTLMSF